MGVRLASVLALGTLLFTGLMGSAPAGAATAPAQRVLVVGDSLSQGFAGDWTWRYWLWREFQRQGVPLDFVGPAQLPSYGTRYERAWWKDGDHAAVGGSIIDYHLPRVTQLVADFTPDVLIVELGYNDIAAGDTATTVQEQLQSLLDTAHTDRPSMRIVLAELPSNGNAQRNTATAEVNAGMATWAAAHGVAVAHNRTGEGKGTLAWDVTKHTFDGLHPNATGQTLMAHRIAQALHRAGVLPGSVTGVYRERQWAPDARPDVAPVAGGLQVRWTTATTQIRVSGVRVVVDGVLRTGWLSPKSATAGVRVAAAAGTHRIQLVPRRGSMIGTPSGYVPVTVR